MIKPLKGQNILVTGGSRGIGAAIVRRVAYDGASVGFTYGRSAADARDLEQALTAEGVKARAYPADAGKPADMAVLIDRFVEDFSRLDVLVNNAGVFSSGGIGEIDPDEYARVMQINVAAVFTLTNAAVRVMQPGSRIINISSVLGERAAVAGLSVYNASKFALTGFSRSWAKDLGAQDIRVNAVQPGPINTEMNPEDGENADAMRQQTALNRYGQPHEVAGAVAFLAGPDATYITGATLNVDGGWNA
ncbi:MAG: 3-oxoacyl-ACP reductase family protein [Desulfobacterales bacterium]|nr:3-oxoacyl-ACP reductase family protein [Desulfobacterales bacterium]MDJ0855471.1 3-oxoacyl-ACP reductase family protein [Desulfobacterales bacterium]MDJ0885846.1 3-oxoacyl-ACP reductase family protein [Desulfobacterales bacterium]MDJ0991515.1 3-oxoacyl-ACP reductase family protein [Desulfobacterales bacterium]